MKSQKRVVIAFVLVLSALLLFGCSSETTPGRQLSKSSFSKEFSDSSGFKLIQGDVISLYNMVEEAYSKSNKSSLPSFGIDSERFDKLYKNITDTVDNYSRENDDARIMVTAAYNAALLNKQVADLELLIVAGGKENKDWFEETDNALNEVYNSFTGEKSGATKTDAKVESKDDSSNNPFIGEWIVTKIYDSVSQSVISSLSGSFITTIKADGKWSMEMTSDGKTQNTSGTWEVKTVEDTETCLLNAGSSNAAVCILDKDGDMNMGITGRDDVVFILEKR